tara:strand:+ start:369 stop:905 length:537 start_codon:yes stop_codon:yes gene_type:complete
MKKGMTLSLDNVNAQMLMCNTDIGIAAHLYDAKKVDDLDISAKRMSVALQFADDLSPILDKCADGVEKTQGNKESSFTLEMSRGQTLKVLTAIRCAFELFVTGTRKDIAICVGPLDNRVVDKLYNEPECTMRLANQAYALLDFLECHCDDDILLEWRDYKRDASRTVLNNMTGAIADD